MNFIDIVSEWNPVKIITGFDPYKVLTFKDKDVRTAVALMKANANCGGY